MELTLDTDDQDRVIYLCILDEKFLAQAIRKKISSPHFSTKIRQTIFKTIVEFYNLYKKPPGIDIVNEIEDKIKKRKIKEDDKELYEEYLLKIFSIQPFSQDLVSDRLDFFIKTRIVTNLSNSLLKLQDHFTIDPDRALKLIREANIEVDSTTGKRGVESILFDPANSIKDLKFVTRFGIDHIDNQLGGGLRPTNYCVIQAYLGIGKSWCINHLAKMAVRFGNSPLVIPTEMANRTARLRFRQSFTGMTAKEVIEEAGKAKKQIAKSMIMGSDIFLLSEEEKGMRVDELPAVIESTESETGKRINPILIDSPDDMLPPEGKHANKLEASTAIHTFLKNYAKRR